MSVQNGDEGISFVEAVCFRPRMYTLNGTFEEVLCFLHGFYTGMITHNTDQKANVFAKREWFNFLQWHDIQGQYGHSADYAKFYHKVLEISQKAHQTPEVYVRETYQKYRELGKPQ